MPSSPNIVYVARTASCAFLLDADGICRRIVPNPRAGREAGRSAARCIGAQYVASLDASIAGVLADTPRVGAAMLFARVDGRGRVSLVRTGAVTELGDESEEDPFLEDDAVPGEVTSRSVETSAPVLAPSFEDMPDGDPYADGDASTRPIDALAGPSLGPAFVDRAELEPMAEDDLLEGEPDDLAKTAEYAPVKTRRGEPLLGPTTERTLGGGPVRHEWRTARVRRDR